MLTSGSLPLCGSKWLVLGLTLVSVVHAQPEGYYMDLFMDGGVHLTSSTSLPAAEALGLSMEYLATENSTLQNAVIIGEAEDTNGRLLYPDGSPRYRILYTNGGSATQHGNSLGAEGRQRIRTFFENGSSYSGSCAGAFLASLHYDLEGIYEPYYHLWPGRATPTEIIDSWTDHSVPDDSPLWTYASYGSDSLILNIRHNGGCFANESLDYPEGTEVLSRYEIITNPSVHGKPSTWAYKPDAGSGRVVVTGSHPEGEQSGEGLDMMMGILAYGLAGNGTTVVKAELTSGEIRNMDRFWEDSLPDFARIGDKQYHHFTIQVPENTSNLYIQLDGQDGFDFNLYANPDTFAFASQATALNTSPGADKSIFLAAPQSGIWFIGVECETTVNTAGNLYYGPTEVLNGLEYSILAVLDTSETLAISPESSRPEDFTLYANYPNPFNPSTTIRYGLPEEAHVSLIIYDVRGHVVRTLESKHQPAGWHEVTWKGETIDGREISTGIYFARLVAGDYNQVIKMMYLK